LSRYAYALKDRQAATDRGRAHKQMVLIDQVVFDQGCGEACATVDDQVLTRLVFSFFMGRSYLY
jgi:hypothetical protein